MNSYLFFLFIFLASFLILYLIISKGFFSNNNSREFLNMGEHQNKKNISSMGGIIFLICPILTLFIFNFNDFSKLLFITTFFSGIIGLIDDIFKKIYKKGLSVNLKFYSQGFFALIGGIILYLKFPYLSYLDLGIIKINMSYFYPFWAAFVIMGTSHAVNLTDGIDGLAGMQSLICCFGITIMHIFNIISFESYFATIILLIMLLAFLFFNFYPAKIFMGDVGSLFLGAFFSTIYLYEKKELFLILSGIIFVIETISTILQIFWIKVFKRKLIPFSPLHHTFEILGFSENKIVFIFSLITVIGNFLVFKLLI